MQQQFASCVFQFGMVCKDSYLIRTVRLIQNASIQIESVHYVLVYMFRTAIRLVRLMLKRYSYGSDVIHTLLRIHTYVIRIQSELRYTLYEYQAEWSDSGGSAKCYNMLENVANPPVPPSPNRHEPYLRYESNSPNFPESILEGD